MLIRGLLINVIIGGKEVALISFFFLVCVCSAITSYNKKKKLQTTQSALTIPSLAPPHFIAFIFKIPIRSFLHFT